jgi:hypothetical protein
MTTSELAKNDFDRAVSKAFWRKVITWLSGQSNDLLPFDLVREHLPIRGQHYLGLKQVEINKIIGSTGRYNDFDRAFLPVQTHTRDRWVSVDMAHYDQVHLPPVELYKMGDIYFVRDGNHRISVARGWGQEFIDAYVTEIDIPVPLTMDTKADDLKNKQEHALFLEKSGLYTTRPGVLFETSIPGQYDRLIDHISFYHWALGQKRKGTVTFEEAAASWCDTVYSPIVEAIREQDILKDFSDLTETDLYLWITKYIWYFRMAYKDEGYIELLPAKAAKKEAARQLANEEKQPPIKRLISLLQRADWIDQIALEQEQASFYEQTQLLNSRPGVKLMTTLPGQFDKLTGHISVHRWYLGEHLRREVSFSEAAQSWYDNVYMPLIKLIRDQDVLSYFPERTETDLYLWVIEEQAMLKVEYESDVSLENAAKQLTEGRSILPPGDDAKN